MYRVHVSIACLIAIMLNQKANAQFPYSVNVGQLDRSEGLVIKGVDLSDGNGQSVSGAGDFNGDGLDDLIIGAPYADPNGKQDAGQSYIVFGNSSALNATLDLNDLDGTNGVAINGVVAHDNSGFSVSGAGDVNGDGFDDVIIGAFRADRRFEMNRFHIDAGASYVVFGNNTGFGSNLDLSNLNGENGFAINGYLPGELSGYSVSGAGDINGDGVDDLIVGAIWAYHNRKSNVGKSYVVFGNRDGFASSLEVTSLNGSNGFVINGIHEGDLSGKSVSGAGDLNGDGVDDLIIGAPKADPGGKNAAGESYVVFGKRDNVDSEFDLANLDGTNGFAIRGIRSPDNSGNSVSGAGDINGDGIGDIVVGANSARPDINSKGSAGESYVIFGDDDTFGAVFDLGTLDGSNGFAISGYKNFGFVGNSVSAAGDINGDGIDDLVIGAVPGHPSESYVIYGNHRGFSRNIELASLNIREGFTLRNFVRSRGVVSDVGDFNGDGIDDLIIGAEIQPASPGASAQVGESYVVFGRRFAISEPAVPEPDIKVLLAIGSITLLTQRCKLKLLLSDWSSPRKVDSESVLIFG